MWCVCDTADVNALVCLLQAKAVVTLKLGAFRAPRNDKSGLVLSMDWLPEKPHNIMAVGFYDGMN